MERKYIELTEESETGTFGKGRPVNNILVPVDLIDYVCERPQGCGIDLANGRVLIVRETFEEVQKCLG